MRTRHALACAACVLLLGSCKRRPSQVAQPDDGWADATSSKTAARSAPAKPSTMPIKAHASAPADKLGTLPEGMGLAIGSRVPDVEVKTHRGEPTRLADLVKTGPLLLIFYRGGW